MAEVRQGFPREYVEFVDPDEPDQVFRCDLTWLTSRWTCIFGHGCRGIVASSPTSGCCALGAHFTDTEDEARVAGHVARLTKRQWQRRAAGKSGWVDLDADAEEGTEPGRKTRVVDGACIFHNDASFPPGAGCALHLHALEMGLSIVATKPDVCWQLPLRRGYRHVDRGDGTTYLEVTIGEFGRPAWGPGGKDLDWYCTSNTEAHVGAEPTYLSSGAELVELMGAHAYAELLDHCRNFEHGTGPRHPAGA